MAVIVLVVFGLSLAGTYDVTLTLLGLLHYAKLVLLFWVISTEVNQPEDFEWMAKGFTVALVILNGYILMQYLTKTNFTIGFNVLTLPSWYEGPFVPKGPQGSANMTGGQVLALMPFGLAVLYDAKHLFSKFFSLMAVLLGCVSLFLTNTRATWGIFPIVFGVFLVLLSWKGRLKWRQTFLYLAIIALIGFFILIKFVDREKIQEISDPKNIYARINLMQNAFRMISAHPLFGVGLNTYADVMGEYIPIALAGEWIYQVHSKYMLVWSETGTVGLIAYLMFLFFIFRTIIRFLLDSKKELQTLGIAVFCSLIAFTLHMFFESYSGGSVAFQFWLVAGLAVALQSYRERSFHQPPTVQSAFGVFADTRTTARNMRVEELKI